MSDYLTCRQLCEKIQVTRSTLGRWTAAGLMPAPLRLGSRTVRWPSSVIEAWLADETFAAEHGDREQAAAAIERAADDDIV